MFATVWAEAFFRNVGISNRGFECLLQWCRMYVHGDGTP